MAAGSGTRLSSLGETEDTLEHVFSTVKPVPHSSVFFCQVVQLDPIIEDDAELQKSSKVHTHIQIHLLLFFADLSLWYHNLAWQTGSLLDWIP